MLRAAVKVGMDKLEASEKKETEEKVGSLTVPAAAVVNHSGHTTLEGGLDLEMNRRDA